MGMIEEMMNAGERTRLLRAMTIKDLEALAASHGVDVAPRDGFRGIGEPTGKDLLVQRIDLATSQVPFPAIKAYAEKLKQLHVVPSGATTDVPESQRAAPMTPTLASQKSSPIVAFEDVYAYVVSYRFISRYPNEREYEIELAGALRERFGTVVRQYPVPGVTNDSNKTLSIDLDVGGTGIEIKYGLERKDQDWDRALTQVERCRNHYGDRLIVLLIGCAEHPTEHRIAELAHVVAKG